MHERRQAAGFAAKKQHVIRADGSVKQAAFTFCRQRPKWPPGDFLRKRRPIVVVADGSKLGVIQSGTAQTAVIPDKAKRVDEMQHRAGIGTEANDVAGIGRDLRLVEGNVLHDESRIGQSRARIINGFVLMRRRIQPDINKMTKFWRFTAELSVLPCG